MSVESGETVYMDESRVMSDDVQTLADSVYKEFEKVIREYDENAVKDLMPLIVSILENLDKAVQDKQEWEVELEMVKEDKEQLLTQYEREKQLRKSFEQKYLVYEDATDEERNKLQGKIESLESLVRLFEIKMKNAQDQISRFEERETENKKEYNKLHERYTDLFKAHIDYREKMKFLGPERISVDNISSRKVVTPSQLPIESVIGVPAVNNPDLFPSKIIVAGSTAMTKAHPPVLGGENVSFDEELKNMAKREARSTREIDMITDNVDVQERGTGTRRLAEMSLIGTDESTFESHPHDISEANLDACVVSDRYHSALAGDFVSFQTPEDDDVEEFSSRPGAHNVNSTSVFDELSGHDMDALGQIDDGADIVGVSKEVENLIQENNELLATKNALNVVKDDLIAKVDQLTSEKEIFREEVHSLEVVRDKLRMRISELEDEIKKIREAFEQEKLRATSTNEDEDDIPMAQRKRFTRVEMARVLLERNQYKERLMELQEAVRWTEMIRASARDSDLMNKNKKSSLWNFFSNLFSSSSKPAKKSIPVATVKYNSPSTVLKPIVEPKENPSQGAKQNAFEFLKDDLVTEKSRKVREQEHKQTGAVVKRDDGRLQAYGWSLPPKFPAHTITEAASMKPSQLPIPVPIYCRPIMEEDKSTKLWCAAAVNLTGGKTRDGGSVVGASVFYSSHPDVPVNLAAKDEVEKLNREIEDHEKEVKSTESNQISSLVWICSTNKNGSEVTVINANNPGDIIENFHVSSSHLLCIASIPGATEDDYEVDAGVIQCDHSSFHSAEKSTDEESSSCSRKDIGQITFIQCDSGRTEMKSTNESSRAAAADDVAGVRVTTADQLEKEFGDASTTSEQGAVSSRSRRFVREPESELVKDGIGSTDGGSRFVSVEVKKSSSILPTMWLGAQSGSIFVHSAVSQWKRCLHTIRLKDSVLSISHVKGRVFVALADGSVAVFRRDFNGQWNLSDYHVITLGESQHSVRCVCVVANKQVWCGYRNTIHIVNPKTLRIEKSFDAHPRKESQVRQMAWVGEGVWLSIRLDSTLRLYHAYTHEHLQDVDIEPYVSKLLGNSKLGFSFVRITCLMVSCNRLWIGTGNGVIISVPLSETNDPGILTSLSACQSNRQAVTSSGGGRPGGVVRVYSDSKTDSIFPGSFIPYCSIAQAQLSFHGHKDAVKFFVTVPGSPSKGVSGVGAAGGSAGSSSEKNADGKQDDGSNLSKNLLVISGGEGYVDFRLGEIEEGLANDDERKDSALSKGDCSHLIVWKVTTRTRHPTSLLSLALPGLAHNVNQLLLQKTF